QTAFSERNRPVVALPERRVSGDPFRTRLDRGPDLTGIAVQGLPCLPVGVHRRVDRPALPSQNLLLVGRDRRLRLWPASPVDHQLLDTRRLEPRVLLQVEVQQLLNYPDVRRPVDPV